MNKDDLKEITDYLFSQKSKDSQKRKFIYQFCDYSANKYGKTVDYDFDKGSFLLYDFDVSEQKSFEVDVKELLKHKL